MWSFIKRFYKSIKDSDHIERDISRTMQRINHLLEYETLALVTWVPGYMPVIPGVVRVLNGPDKKKSFQLIGYEEDGKLIASFGRHSDGYKSIYNNDRAYSHIWVTDSLHEPINHIALLEYYNGKLYLKSAREGEVKVNGQHLPPNKTAKLEHDTRFQIAPLEFCYLEISMEYEACEVICLCKKGTWVHNLNRPSLLSLLSTVKLGFPVDSNGPLVVTTCSHCHNHLISVRKSREIVCKHCDEDQLLLDNYDYSADLRDVETKEAILHGNFNTQFCSRCGHIFYHQFVIDPAPETPGFVYEIIRSINQNCMTSEDYLENARTMYYLKEYDLAFDAYTKAGIENLSIDKNTESAFNDFLLMAFVNDRLENREKVPYWINKALSIKPEDASALKMLGHSYINLELWDQAVKPYEKIINDNISISDMFVDNLYLRLESFLILANICEFSGNSKKSAHWENEANKMYNEYPFLIKHDRSPVENDAKVESVNQEVGQITKCIEVKHKPEDKIVEQQKNQNRIMEDIRPTDPFDGQMVLVRGGTFTMGCTSEQENDCSDHELPAHQVTLSDFHIGKFPVTQKQWRQVINNNPSHHGGCDDCPVDSVSWYDVWEFIRELNKQTGKRYRLPTEAEWEYAARGGNHSKGYKYAGSNTIKEVACYDSNSSYTTQPVGQKKANELGLHDMSGNVWEWCEDDWHGNYKGAPADGRAWIDSPRGTIRVLRGGSWYRVARFCRVSGRVGNAPIARRSDDHGFRLALSP